MLDLYKNIKQLREEKGLSQGELAKLTGYTNRSSIAKIEKGEVDLSQSKILAFAKALGTTPEKLVGWEKIDDRFSGKEAPDSIYAKFTKDTKKHYLEDEKDLIFSYRKLNVPNKKKVLTYSKNLLSTQQMEDDLLAAHARTDVEQTPEDVQHNLDIMKNDSFWD